MQRLRRYIHLTHSDSGCAATSPSAVQRPRRYIAITQKYVGHNSELVRVRVSVSVVVFVSVRVRARVRVTVIVLGLEFALHEAVILGPHHRSNGARLSFAFAAAGIFCASA